MINTPHPGLLSKCYLQQKLKRVLDNFLQLPHEIATNCSIDGSAHLLARFGLKGDI